MKKLLLSLVLVFFVALSSTRVYLYSQDLNIQQLTSENSHILISQKLESEDGKYLVPTGSILGVDDTEKMVFKYTVFVVKGMEMHLNIIDVKINNEIVSSEIIDLFIFEFEINSIKLDSLQLDLTHQKQVGYFMEITVNLTMKFPTEEQYSLIAGSDLSFEISFNTSKIVAANTM